MSSARSNESKREMNLKIIDKIFERIENFKYLGTTVKSKNDVELGIK